MEKHVFLPGKRGFTLIELMVVVSIIGILMAAGIVTFSNAQKAARDAKRRADVDAIAKAAEQYYADTGQYATSRAVYWSTVANWTSGEILTILGDKFPSGRPPVDPLNGTPYIYGYEAISQNYPGAPNPTSRFCSGTRLEIPNGNCSGAFSNNSSNPNSFKCPFVTPGTGTHYCVQNRQ